MKKSIFIVLGLGFLMLQSCKKDYECTMTTTYYSPSGTTVSTGTFNYYGITTDQKKTLEEVGTNQTEDPGNGHWSTIETICVPH